MGAKFAMETNKLDVPGAGSYEPPSKVCCICTNGNFLKCEPFESFRAFFSKIYITVTYDVLLIDRGKSR